MLSFLVLICNKLKRALGILALTLLAFSTAQAQSVSAGQGIYRTTGSTGYGVCSSCHFGTEYSTTQSVTAPGHPNASNDPTFLKTALSSGGLMYAAAGGTPTPPSDANITSLALYIGQYFTPHFNTTTSTLSVKSGGSATKDVWGYLASGTSGGSAADNGLAASASHGTATPTQAAGSLAMQYNIGYTSNANYTGSDSISVTATNPKGTSNTHTIGVTVYGFTSAPSSATGDAGVAYTSGSPLATFTSNDSSATFAASGLPAGLSMTTGGKIVGTPTTPTSSGAATVTVTVTLPSAVDESVKTLSTTISVTIQGFTNASSLSLSQGATTNLPFNVAVYPSAAISLSGTLPPGVTYDSANKRLTSTSGPLTAGSYPVTLTSGSLSQTLTITVAQASAPVITTDLAQNNPTVLGTVGTAITAFHILATNPQLVSQYYVSGVSGLSVDSTGLVTGTPTVSGDFTLSLNATNGALGTAKTVSVRVNADQAPVISSAGTATGAVGTNATQYTIATSGANGPLTTTPYSASGLPPGLSVNSSTGAISGAPTVSGIYSVTVSAINTGNLTGSKTVVFTINPNAVSTITSPANGASTVFTINTTTTVQLVATNLPATFAVTPALPAGFSLNTATGLITILPTAPMASTAYTFTATNLIGPSAPITLNFAVGSPAPTGCTLTTPLNTAQTLDLSACMFNGLSPTGFTVSVAPGHGSTQLSGTKLTYTPAKDYFGTDSMMVVASFGALKASAGTVSITVTGRPDPTQNAAVTGLVANQTQTALRFSQAQVSNFGRHMESLRRPGGPGGQRSGLGGLTPAGAQVVNNPGSDSAWNTTATGNGNFGNAALTNMLSAGMPQASAPGMQVGNATQLPTGTNPTASLPVESGVSMAMNQLGVPNAPLIGLLYNLNQNRTLDLGALKSAFGSDGQSGATLPGTSVWVEGVVSFGSRDANGAVSATEYSSNGISVGVDIPVSDAFTWGMGVGLARDVAYIGTDGSRNQSQGYSVAAYGSYLFGENAFVEGMLGVGTIDYDMRRWVDPMADFALSNRKGLQIFGSIGTGLEYRNNGRMISPYVRLDFSQDRLDEVSETGAGNYALHYFEQTNNSSQAVLGLRGEAVHSTSFGWAVPRARVEWRQDLMDGSDAVISYADQIGGTRYSIAPTDSRRSAMVLGLGSEFLFRDGWSFGLDYQLSRVSSSESSYALRMRLTKELGAKGLRNLLKGDEEITDDENEITVDSSATWDDNITRAKLGSDIRSDMVYTVNVSRTLEYQLTGNTRFLLTGVATGERFQNFNGLSRFALGAEATLQYRGSADFDAPTWGLVGKVTGEDYQSSLRDGIRSSVGGTWLQPLTDRITLFSALMYNTRQANDSVFETQDTSLRMNVDYSLGKGATLYLTGEYRDGDIVSTGHRSLENITIAQARVQDDAYPNGEFFSYRLKGTTALFTLGYNVGLGARDSLDFSWRYVQSTPELRPAWATSPSSYISNQLSATYLMRF
ncbi:autotransporter domain-containing protein [Rhodoferax sp. GW822-FHT02A01]|uniref:autotransporter domain-containing protein n=1 Tax=Rhodoferax sp. GW822-FHT02A01 TaxID=3141537 RepID=UPI00315DD03A